jgi:hypothetical protein
MMNFLWRFLSRWLPGMSHSEASRELVHRTVARLLDRQQLGLPLTPSQEQFLVDHSDVVDGFLSIARAVYSDSAPLDC